MQNVFAPRQCGNQHDECALRQVEIRHERVDAAELIAGVNKNIRPAGSGAHGAVRLRKALQRPARSGADRDDAAANGLRFVDDLRRLLRHHAKFRVHGVILNVFLLDRAEGPQTNMQRHVANAHAFGGNSLQQLLRKMQPRRRRGRTSKRSGIDRLIPLAVLQFLLDIRWQRHLPESFENLQKNALIVKLQDLVSVLNRVHDRGGKRAFAKGQLRAGACLAARTRETLPLSVAQVAQQHDLHAPAGAALAEQPRREHARVVQNKAVARVQIFGKVVKMTVLDCAGHAIQLQKARRIAPLQRRLRDQFLRQLKIKI